MMRIANSMTEPQPPANGPARTTPFYFMAAAIGLWLAWVGPESWLMMLGGVVLLLGIRLLWRTGESPILLLLFTYQWTQVNVKTLQAQLLDLQLDRLSSVSSELHYAIVLSNLALVALAIGLRWGAGPEQPHDALLARRQTLQTPIGFWLRLYAAAWVVTLLAKFAIAVVPGLFQPLLALSFARWAAFFALTHAAFNRPRPWRAWWLLFAGEFILSLGGFFSDFKEPMVFALLGMLAALTPIRLRRAIPLAMLATLLALTGVVWSAVKGDYRQYVSGGQGQQVVTVGKIDGIRFLADKVASLSSDDMAAGLDAMASRLSYVEFFGRVIEIVPKSIEHEDGALWGDALIRIVTPRLLFPNKTVVDDSYRTKKYADIDSGEGTSISLGYVAENYIDFGVPLMFVPSLLLGWAMGRFCQLLQRNGSTQGIWGMALASISLWPALGFETSVTKMVPGLAINFLVIWLIVKYAIPRLSQRVRRVLARNEAMRGVAT
jgi:hypothetical protein